ncbi:MAG: adenylate/guanylate cyclase domain-containing protein [Pirellulales bacterium]
MPDLIAQGPLVHQRWRRRLPVGRAVTLGRGSGAWEAPWDDRISRSHAALRWHEGRLEVRVAPAAKNPVFWRGQPSARFDAEAGEHFVIGQTTFTVVDESAEASLEHPRPRNEQTFSAEYLRRLPYRNAAERIEALSRLPDLIAGDPTERELFVRVVNTLLAGVSRATAVALVSAADDNVQVLHWDRRDHRASPFRPSERLIRAAVEREEAVLHVWSTAGEVPQHYTAAAGLDWAFAMPLSVSACRGWALYVAGSLGPGSATAEELRDDLKFAELAAQTLSALCETRALERRQAALGQFFSPVVLEALAEADPEQALAPREADVVVLFCDLRGFSRRAEREAGDLLGLLRRVSRALGVATAHILAAGGVVGDFQGDAVMGFWGWPLTTPDDAQRAAAAALAIRAEFAAAARDPADPLAGFEAGLGLAAGRAVAGKIGTADQVKVTAFGPVVNLASRLEGMTRLLRAPVLLDEPLARRIQVSLPGGQARVRRLAVVRPVGMDNPLTVCELLPPAAEDASLTDAQLAAYEQAFDDWQAGRWEAAFARLHEVPATDRAKDFLTAFIAQHQRTPPADWDGAIQLGAKG